MPRRRKRGWKISRGGRSTRFSLFLSAGRTSGPVGHPGGIAQLVERLLCKQDVIGSNPVTSTSFPNVK